MPSGRLTAIAPLAILAQTVVSVAAHMAVYMDVAPIMVASVILDIRAHIVITLSVKTLVSMVRVAISDLNDLSWLVELLQLSSSLS